ncbi:MAG: DUF4157 domain-containing protein [Nostoc sp. TH1S01]|nr:DUF4157 domain-containing protein [Nostoc sp. TH1S01]
MYTRQYKTKKTSTNSAETSTTNQFAPRRFVVQPDEEITNNQTSDLQAKSGNRRNLPNISVFPSSETLQPSPIQMKLTIGQPGDKYEQEADRLAADVVQQINAPENQQVQREAAPEEEEVQMKPISGSIQREAAPEEEEVRMKPIVQRLSGAGGMTATPDLEQSIQQARSSGQPLTESIREPMEQAFSADFSGVKVHTDAQSDELNQSIQAKAFTTGQDIFFRQGEYQPGNRGGQELIAHELTHVVQQSGGVVRRAQRHTNKQINSNSSLTLQKMWIDERDELKAEDYPKGKFNKVTNTGYVLITLFHSDDRYRNIQLHWHPAKDEKAEIWTVRWANEAKGNISALQWMIDKARDLVPFAVKQQYIVNKSEAEKEIEWPSLV